MGTPWKAIGIVVAFVGSIFLAALVLTGVARSQGGTYELVPDVSGRAVVAECAPDVLALGLRFRCSGTVQWSDGSATAGDIYSPGDVSGKAVEVQQVSSYELKGSRSPGTRPADLRTLTLDHPVGSTAWTVVGYAGPPVLLFLVVGALWLRAKLFGKRGGPRRRRPVTRHSPGA